MGRKIVAIIIFGLLSGCATMGGATKTDIQYVYKPILVCPEPPSTSRPLLLIDQLSEDDKVDPGKVAQSYKATVKQMSDYIEELETIIKHYDTTSKQYEELRKVVDEKFPQ